MVRDGIAAVGVMSATSVARVAGGGASGVRRFVVLGDAGDAVGGIVKCIRDGVHDCSPLTELEPLVSRGIDSQRARLLVLVGERYTVGWVLEEQSPAPPTGAIDVDELRTRFPVMTSAIVEYFSGTGRTADDLYRDGARLILRIDD